MSKTQTKGNVVEFAIPPKGGDTVKKGGVQIPPGPLHSTSSGQALIKGGANGNPPLIKGGANGNPPLAKGGRGDFTEKKANGKYSHRELFADLLQLRQKLRSDIEAFAIGLDPAGKPQRRARVLGGDFEFFAYTYFPHHIRGEPSQFQAQFCRRFPQLLQSRDGCREWWVAPRGECKSSLLTKIGPVYVAVLGLLQQAAVRAELEPSPQPSTASGGGSPFIDYVILLGAETRLPTKLIEVVKTELTCNSALAMDFPDACGRGPVWKVGEFVSKTAVKFEPFGAEQAIRGTFHGAARPKLLLGDDLITDREAKSPVERDNRWNWLEKAIDYLGPPDGTVKYCGVGTVLNADDPLSRAKKAIGHTVHHFKAIVQLPRRMDLWEQCEGLMRNDDPRAEEEATADGRISRDEDRPSFRFWQQNRAAMEAGSVTSWPAVRSLYWLMRQRAKNKRAFETEMQGVDKSDEDRVFQAFTFWLSRSPHWRFFGACDPSMGNGQTADPSALVVGGWDTERNLLNVIESKSKRRVPSMLEYDLTELQREYPMVAIGFENNGAFEHMRTAFVANALAKGVALPLVGVTNTVGQELLIAQLEPFVCDRLEPRILFNASLSTLLDHLDHWPDKPSGHHYDDLVALAILWHIALTRGPAGASAFHRVPLGRGGRRG